MCLAFPPTLLHFFTAQGKDIAFCLYYIYRSIHPYESCHHLPGMELRIPNLLPWNGYSCFLCGIYSDVYKKQHLLRCKACHGLFSGLHRMCRCHTCDSAILCNQWKYGVYYNAGCFLRHIFSLYLFYVPFGVPDYALHQKPVPHGSDRCPDRTA